MKVKYKSNNGQFEVEFDVQNNKQLFEEIAEFQDIFEQGKKGGKNYRFVVRQVGDGTYYELLCLDDGEKLAFSPYKKNPSKLYPRRVNQKTKEKIGNFGWHKYNPEDYDKEDK